MSIASRPPRSSVSCSFSPIASRVGSICRLRGSPAAATKTASTPAARRSPIAPHNVTAIFNIALAHEHQQHYTEAMAWTRRGLEINPKDASLSHLELRLRMLQLRAAILRGFKSLIGRRSS